MSRFCVGFVTGEIFGGEVTLGATGVAGAALGGFIQGTIGEASGVVSGFVSAKAAKQRELIHLAADWSRE